MLLLIVLIQNKGCKKETLLPSKIDSVVLYDTIRDTIPGKPIYIKTRIDTSIWMKKVENTPDTSYSGLLSQYKKLGNKHFSTNFFKTDFKIADYGTITIRDSVKENVLISSTITTDLKLPTIIRIEEKESQKKRQLYIGGEISSSRCPLYGGLLLRNKKDVVYGASLGYEDKLVYKGSLYFPLKIK